MTYLPPIMRSIMTSYVLYASRHLLGSQPTREEVEEEEKISFCDKLIVPVDDQPMNIDVLVMLLVKKLERDVVFCSSRE